MSAGTRSASITIFAILSLLGGGACTQTPETAAVGRRSQTATERGLPEQRTAESTDAALEFSSGGAYHFQGYGAWIIRVDSAGRITIKHQVMDAIRDYGAFQLESSETSELWSLIREMEIKNLPPPRGAPNADEVEYSFVLEQAAEVHEV